MSDILINGKVYSGVDTINVKTSSGGTAKYTEGERPSGTKEISTNGTHNVEEYESVNVDVADIPAVLQEKTATENGEVVPDTGFDGLSKVTVNVQPTLQDKTVTPTTSQQVIEADNEYDGLRQVTVNAVEAKEEEIKTVALDMTSGNQVIMPTTNKVMTQVTIEKPATLLPENIKKDVVIGGIAGTLESGGSSNMTIEILEISSIGKTPRRVKVNNTTEIYDGCFFNDQYNSSWNLLVEIQLPPNLLKIGSKAFQNCKSLSSIHIPSTVTTIKDRVFAGTPLSSIDIPAGVNKIEDYAFSGATYLNSLTLRSPTVCTLINANAFNNTLIAGGTGYIYVPADLVESYKSATNWSTYASQIVAITE